MVIEENEEKDGPEESRNTDLEKIIFKC